jgi:nucleotide-binding universal stress UspA family protein
VFKRILYPTDFSDVSKKAMDYIQQLKDGGAETVLVLHVIDQRGLQALEQYASAKSLELEQRIMDDAKQDLQALEDELKKSGFAVETRIETGVPVREILKAEAEENPSVIVIGSHGKSNLEEMFLGSVSEKVARKCKRPVLIIKR